MITKLIDAFIKVAAAKPLKPSDISRRYRGIVGDSIKMRNQIRKIHPETLEEHLKTTEVPTDVIERIKPKMLRKPVADELITHPGQDITEDDSDFFGRLNTGHLPRRVLGSYLNKMRRLNKTVGSQIIENPRIVPLFMRLAFNQKLPIDVTPKDVLDTKNLTNAGRMVADRKYPFENYRSGVRTNIYKLLKSRGIKPTVQRMSAVGGLSDTPAPRNSGSDIPGRIPAEKADRAAKTKPDWGYRAYGDNG